MKSITLTELMVATSKLHKETVKYYFQKLLPIGKSLLITITITKSDAQT